MFRTYGWLLIDEILYYVKTKKVYKSRYQLIYVWIHETTVLKKDAKQLNNEFIRAT